MKLREFLSKYNLIDILKEEVKNGMPLEHERWRHLNTIEGFDNLSIDYIISNYGRLCSIKNGKVKYYRPKVQTRSKNKTAMAYCLCFDYGIKKWFLSHRLVGFAFLPKAHTIETINHKNGEPMFNYYHNLEWMTIEENNIHRNENGLLDYSPKPYNRRKIVRINTNTNKIKIYESIISAYYDIGISPCNVIACCKHHRDKSYGYKWMYLDEYKKEGAS